MSQVDYAKMSDEELKQYFLKHRLHDEAAFYAYMDRLNARPRKIIATLGDPDFEEKVKAAILSKIQAAEAESEVKD